MFYMGGANQASPFLYGYKKRSLKLLRHSVKTDIIL